MEYLEEITAWFMHTVGRFLGSNFMLCNCLFKSVGTDFVGGEGGGKLSLLVNLSNIIEGIGRELDLPFPHHSRSRYTRAEV